MSDWLDQVQEEILEPDRPICDPHHHLWDHADSRYLLDAYKHKTGGATFSACVLGTARLEDKEPLLKLIRAMAAVANMPEEFESVARLKQFDQAVDWALAGNEVDEKFRSVRVVRPPVDQLRIELNVGRL